MLQRSYWLSGREDVAAAVERAKSEASKLPRLDSVLAVVFLKHTAVPLWGDILGSVRGAFSGAEVCGATVDMSVTDGTQWLSPEWGEDSDILGSLTFMFFERSSARAMVLPDDPVAAGTMLRQVLDEDADARAVGLLISDMRVDFNPLFREISHVRPEIVFFGGTAWAWSEPEGRRLFCGDAVLTRGVVAIVFSGRELHACENSSFGWTPMGPELTVTRMKDDFTVCELDGKPAGEVLEYYLGWRESWDPLEDAMAFPLCFERGGQLVGRHLNAFLDDGSIQLDADLRVGEKLRISCGAPFAILREAAANHRRMTDFRPEAFIAVSCAGRHQILRENRGQEFDVLRQLAPSSGFYSYGEVQRNGGEVSITNLMLVTVAFREGEPKGAEPSIQVTPLHLQKQTSVIAHLLHMVHVMTQEWEDARGRLVVLAERDGLTSLLNRRAMEESLRQILRERVKNPQDVAVLMIDLDDFKGINDTYGHAMGDKVLVTLAEILRNSTRRNDAICRWGGDEFFVILAGASRVVAERIAERIRSAVSALSLLPDGRRLTLSIGLASVVSGDTPARLFHRLDEALYASKRMKGKNRVMFR